MKFSALFLSTLLLISCKSPPKVAVAETPQKKADLSFFSNDLRLSKDQMDPQVVAANDPQCVEFWAALTTPLASDLFTQMFKKPIPMPGACEKPTSDWVIDSAIKYYLECKPMTVEEAQKWGACASGIMLLRGTLIDHLAVFDPDISKVSTNLLLNRFAVRLYSKTIATDLKAQLPEQTRVLKELQKRHPGSPLLAKGECMVKELAYRNSKTPTEAKELETAIVKAEKLNPTDEEILNVHLLFFMDQKRLMEYSAKVGEIMRKNPHSKVGAYHLARIKWLNKKQDQAMSLLSQLQKDFPDDPDISSTIERSKTAQLGADIFPIQINLNLN